MEKVTIDYGRLCLELEKQGKTKADLSRDMAKNKNFVGLMAKNPDQPADRRLCRTPQDPDREHQDYFKTGI